MLDVRFHGRGGQGVVTSAELLSAAAFLDGHHAQAFPSFGSERTGAPVVAFCRVSDAPIRSHEPISRPDVVVIQDPTLLHQVEVFAGLDPEGYLLVNSRGSFADLGLAEYAGRFPASHALCVPATDLARTHLGRPLPGSALLGALAGMTGLVTPQALAAAMGERFPGALGEGNVAAAEAALALVEDRVHA